MKTCITCNIEKDLSEFNTARNKNKCIKCCYKHNKKQLLIKKNNVIVTTTKICTGCNIEKNILEFNINRNKCKKCNSKLSSLRINNNKNSFLGKLLSTAKKTAKHRKELASEFNITINDLINLTIQQNDKCYYSGIELSYEMYSNWQTSLERLNPLLGYINTNIALICLEFQSPSQWTPTKYKEFTSLLFNNHEKQIVNFNPSPKKLTLNKIKREIINDIEYITCNCCKIIKISDDFAKSTQHTCKECISKKDKLYKETPKGHLKKLIKSMISSSIARKHESPELTYQDLIDLFELQNGLCYYSKIPLMFGYYSKQYWTCSVERKNSLIGYTKENCILICFEFNTMDNTNKALNKEDIKGSGQWSIEKIEFIKNMIISKDFENSKCISDTN
jgi:hypothetical protein